MRQLFCILFFSLVSIFSFGQSTFFKAPQIQWQRCLGGTAKDVIRDAASTFTIEERPLSITTDSGYILGGSVSSNDGDITGNHGGFDIWLTRLNQYGSTIWKKTFGGTLNEQVSSIQETSDGGYIAVGSTSSNDGDVSGNHGRTDVWVLKLDVSGNIQWQKCLGGSNTDMANEVKATPDNGYIITGFTQSSNGDVAGNHQGIDSTDVWVVKLNSSGSIVWQKCFGGSSSDIGVSIDLTSDGGFILANTTMSNDGDVSGNHGSSDIWVIKLSQDGNIVWQKCYGGSLAEEAAAIKRTSGGGFAFVGSARSSNGDVVGHNGPFDDLPDGWFVKLDSLGNIGWNKCYGQFNSGDRFNDFIELANGDYVACGFLTGPCNDCYHGLSDKAWIMNFTSLGTKVWENSFGGLSAESAAAIVKSAADGYLILGTTIWGNNSYHYSDVIGAHISPITGYDEGDLWVVKLGSTNSIKGVVYLDRNKNGTKEAGEPLITGGLVKSIKGGVGNSSIPNGGLFLNTVDTGSYVTTIQFNPYYIAVPASKISNFTNYNNKDSFSFALQPLSNKRDLAITIIPSHVARPGFNMSYRIYYKNNGTDTIANGDILFKKDSRFNFVSALPSNNSSNGDTLKWSYSNLKPLDTASILVNLKIQAPPAVNINDTLSSLAIITPVAGDITPSDDTAYLNQRVFGSFDPNDKSENLAGKISLREVSVNSYINYLIRFQNTGTDTAFNITVRDTLDDKLDWNSLQMVAASHSYQLNIKSQNQLTWSFNNILLVDSNRNEPASHGFIAYRVKPKNNLVIGDIIENTASIYFDYNLPVETNTQETEIVLYSINNPQVGIPTISSFTPVSGGSGASITITGANLTGATAVSFGGVAASSYTVNSSTSITAIVATGASGNVSVTTAGGTATLAGFTFIPAPTITSFNSATGAEGASITITGTNFTGASAVSFGGVAPSLFTVNSSINITAVVGTGASGDVSVTTPGGSAILAGFTFIPAPTITSFTPTSGGAGASITITGTGLTDATTVSFGGVAANSFAVNSATSITAVVGTGASGEVSVTTPGGTVTLSGFTFTVVTAIDPIPANALGIRFYPNPTRGNFVIDSLKLSDRWETLEIVDTEGRKKVTNFNIRNKTRVNVNVDQLSNGMYIAILRTKSGSATVVKFLKL